MDWRKTAATALLALVVVVCMTGCPSKPPATPGAPWGADSTWTYSTYTCSVVTTISRGNIRYIMDWQDAIDTGDIAYASGETAAVTHEWDAVGTYDVKAQAIRDDDPKKASDFSPAKSVKVALNQRPVVDSVLIPPVAVMGAPTNITVYGHDDDGDSLRAIVRWSSSKDTTTELTPTPCFFTVSYVFTKVETADVIVWVQDWKKAKSLPDTVRIPVGKEGGVKWYWQGVEEGPMSTSALIANDGSDEVVMSYCWDDWTFRAITVAKGKPKHSATTQYPEYDFDGGPALCAATNHVIVGSSEGELYALTLSNLSRDWRWPNVTPETAEPYIEFGAPAINGNDIYVGRDQDYDTLYRLYKFTDGGGSVTKAADYILGSNQAVVDAPAIDADGSVYFGTDSGYLIKIDANLTSPLWKRHLIPLGEINGPIIGSDGTVYCASDSPPALYAINPDSTDKWAPLVLDGLAARPALGQSALFVGSEAGTAYSINPATGSVNWTFHDSIGSFATTPIVAANGYVYFQDDQDVLFCLNQADGSKIWACDCNYYLPGGGRSGGGSHRPRVAGLLDYDPNPSITSTGDIIVVGSGALFCVAGYSDGPLDPTAPWPKWQKDLYNTGKR
jgi:outer membrane protein assembly factor BamB